MIKSFHLRKVVNDECEQKPLLFQRLFDKWLGTKSRFGTFDLVVRHQCINGVGEQLRVQSDVVGTRIAAHQRHVVEWRNQYTAICCVEMEVLLEFTIAR